MRKKTPIGRFWNEDNITITLVFFFLFLLFCYVNFQQEDKKSTVHGYFYYWKGNTLDKYCEAQHTEDGRIYVCCMDNGFYYGSELEMISRDSLKTMAEDSTISYYKIVINNDNLLKIINNEEEDNYKYVFYNMNHPKIDIIKALNENEEAFNKAFFDRALKRYKLHFEDREVDTEFSYGN